MFLFFFFFFFFVCLGFFFYCKVRVCRCERYFVFHSQNIHRLTNVTDVMQTVLCTS